MNNQLNLSCPHCGQRQVLGDWRVEETSPGMKTFDLEIPHAPS